MSAQPSNVSHRAEVSDLKNEHQEKKEELDQTLDMEMNTVCSYQTTPFCSSNTARSFI